MIGIQLEFTKEKHSHFDNRTVLVKSLTITQVTEANWYKLNINWMMIVILNGC